MIELELISDYLIENSYADSYDDAIQLISAMSEGWMETILEEQLEYLEERLRRKAVKNPETGKMEVVRREKTPLTVSVTNTERKRIERTPTGDWRTTTPRSHTRDVLNPKAAAGITKQGGSKTRPELVRRGLLPHIPPEHFSSAELKGYKPSAHGTGGPRRGVRKVRGEKVGPKLIKQGGRWSKVSPETPVSKFKQFKAAQQELESRRVSPYTTPQERRSIEDSIIKMSEKSPLTKARVRQAARARQRAQQG